MSGRDRQRITEIDRDELKQSFTEGERWEPCGGNYAERAASSRWEKFQIFFVLNDARCDELFGALKLCCPPFVQKTDARNQDSN